MSDSFGESITPAHAIRNILDSYPFSVGLFRELLQNSDDAKASKQIFVLDRRTHKGEALLHPYLQSCQGPALLAYNDGVFEEQDWIAIREISNSSKKADTTKIGKYGLGFRSCYHVTDHPHILSGGNLAIFDPEKKFNQDGGIRVAYLDTPETTSDHLAALGACVPSPLLETFPGTVIRLPLRTEEGLNSLGKAVSVNVIHELLLDFVHEELKVVLLFLKHVSSVELRVVDDAETITVAHVEVERETSASQDINKCHIVMSRRGEEERQSWIVHHHSADLEEISEIMSKRLQSDVRTTLIEKKLQPRVSLAFPMPNHNSDTAISGRLFTFLPLPIYTGFPCHLHGLFALTPDRQHLVNAEETGLPEGSPHRRLVEWNRILFEIVVPVAWNRALEYFAAQKTYGNIFQAWPEEQPQHAMGDVAYWAQVPEKMAKTCSRTARIWPIHRPLSATLESLTSLDVSDMDTESYTTLDTVLVISRDSNTRLCDVLASATVLVSQIPLYIHYLLRNVDASVSLVPRRAWEKLSEVAKEKKDALVSMKPGAIHTILDYLVSKGEVCNVLELPLFNTRIHFNVALQAANAGVTRVLLKSNETFFADFDDAAILLRGLPPNVVQVLLSHGPTVLNVEPLSQACILGYVQTCTQQLENTAWLLTFWSWLATSNFASKLMSDATFLSLPTLPALGGAAYSILESVFTCPNNTSLATALGSLGYRLLHANFPSSAAKMMKQHDRISFPDDLHALIHYMPPGNLPASWSQSDAVVLRDHVRSILSRFGAKKRLDPALRVGLRSLPVYEVCTSDADHATWTRIATNHTIASIVPPAQLVPSIDGMTFVRELDNVIVKHLDQLYESGRTLTYPDLVNLSVQHLPRQTKAFQSRFLRDVVLNKDRIPPKVLNQLQRTPFIETSAGTQLQPPLQVLDPACDIARLYDFDSVRLPSSRHDDHIEISKCLGLNSLGLLRTTFTSAIIEEIIHRVRDSSISLERRHATSCSLLELVRKHKFQCNGLSPKPEWTAWLPTENLTLALPQECIDPYLFPRELFDQIVPALATEMPSAMRKLLSMNSPVLTDIIVRQLDAAFGAADSENKYKRLVIIYTELGRRHSKGEILPDTLKQLAAMTTDRSWIPIEPGVTVGSSRAAFELPFSNASDLGFHSVPSTLSALPGVRDLFQSLGCPSTPNRQALVDELSCFSGTLDSSQAVLAITLLRALSITSLTEDTLRRLQVPDASSTMRPYMEIYYNDLGHRVTQIEIPSERYPSHVLVDTDLARLLKLSFLSSIALPMAEDEIDDDDMEEALTTRISNVLRQYSPERSFFEAVANAVDAGATQVSMLLDETSHAQVGDFLTQEMASFQGRSLVIHNNAIFQEKDWKGIRRIGQGGKQGSDTIGRFGLGALSMFHFTEVAMIVSNKHVLFIDPSRQHISSEKNRASRKISLQTARQMYQEHLRPLDGLFGFSLQSDHYDGTLFRLAIRTPEQVKNSEMTTAELDVMDLVMEQFRRAAEDCLLFAPISSIDGKRRDSYSRVHDVWSWKAERSVIADDNTGRRIKVSVSQYPVQPEAAMNARATATATLKEWTILERRIACLKRFAELKEKHRMPSLITIGLAAPTKTPLRSDAGHKLFSSMPLPVTMPLPVHVNASFILADDRRNIRFDQSGMENPETEFNRWLLSEAIPGLYTDLLALLPMGDPSEWWPRQRASKHHLAGPLVQGFYKHISRCQAQICVDVRGQRVAPQVAVFLRDDDTSISRLYRHVIRPSGLVFLPTSDLRLLASQAKVTQMNPDHARAYLMTHSLDFTAAYNRKDLRSRDIDIQALITFLEPSRLKDMPLLLLADETLTSFSSSRKLTFFPKLSSEYPWPFLPADRFVHPNIDLKHCVQEPDLRIAPLNNAAVGQLMRDRIPDGASRDLSPEDAAWARTAWSMIEKLSDPRENPVDISSLPLIPTASNLTHVSLQACTAKNSQVLIASPLRDRLIRQVLEHFGASFIETDGFPSELMKRLETGKFNFETALRFLHSIGPTMLRSRFDTLGPSNQKRLAEWITDHIEKKSKKDIKGLPGIAFLPIWTSYQGSVERYEVMANIHMLPPGVSPGIVRDFMPHLAVCAYSKVMEDLGKSAMAFSQFRDSLAIPGFIDDTLGDSYARLLNVILQYRARDARPPLVPNRSGTLVLPSTLFASNEDVFTAAFATQPHRFIHIRYIDQESALQPYGFNNRVDITTFLACAQAIHQDTTSIPSDRLARALVLFECFSNQLPHEIANVASSPAAWRQLDRLNFIPARRDRRRSTMWCHDYANRLEEDALRSPATMLRSDLQGIAWTQRHLFAQEPAPLLFFADKQLGMPTVMEVVDHLVILSTRIAVDHPRNDTVLQDLRDTYSWLAQTTRVAQSGRILNVHRDKAIWLNVDNPQEDAWIWNSADQIVFNGQDSEKNNQREAHSWMSNYKQLLLASGAREIHRPAAPVITLTPVEAQYRAARATVDTLRTGRKLTDVIFVAEGGQEFVAHRIWMATASDYFLDMFAGSSGFSESSDDISPANPVRIDVQFPSIAVRVCLDYVYLRSLPGDLEDDDLVAILRLAHFWELSDTFQQIQQLIVDTVDIYNYEYLEEEAKSLDATHILKACREFATKNASQL